MEQNIDNPKKQSKTVVESVVVEPVATGKFKAEPEDDEELDLDLDLDDDEEEEEGEEPEEESDESDEEEEAKEEKKPEPAKKPQTREQKQLKALKIDADRKNAKIAELEKQLAEKKLAAKEDEIASQYIDEGHTETEAKKRAKEDVERENMRKQLAVLMFEKQNRKVLSKYPDADSDLEIIMKAAESGVMTVEEICRGKYGAKPEREIRAIKALTDDGEQVVNNSVSRSMRTASAPVKTKLTREQQEVKRTVDALAKRQGRKPPTDEEFLKNIYE